MGLYEISLKFLANVCRKNAKQEREVDSVLDGLIKQVRNATFSNVTSVRVEQDDNQQTDFREFYCDSHENLLITPTLDQI